MIISFNPIKQCLSVSILSTLLSACTVFRIHEIDVQQGNALDQKAMTQLEVGMNAEQVRYLLGNPLIDDSYHANRWDYVYYFKPGHGPAHRRKLTVFFENGQVVRIEQPQKGADG
jgi:outer membrane protein assembly factor BamE